MIALTALLLATAVPTVVDAERAFDRAAARDGQWTAFRHFAAPDAVLFAPNKMRAQDFLIGRADPSASVRWHPAATVTSCDGTLAVSVGPWRKGKEHGTYVTVWRHDAAGWHWIYDDGNSDRADRRISSNVPLRQTTACSGKGRRELQPITSPQFHPPLQIDGYPALALAGESADGTLSFRVWVGNGTRGFFVVGWDGSNDVRLLSMMLDQ